MTPQEKQNLRVQRILNDPTLLKQLVRTVRERPGHVEELLAEITDEHLREQMRAAIEASA